MNTTNIKTFLITHRRYLLLIGVDLLFFGVMSPNASAFVIIPAFVLIILSMYAILKLVTAYGGRVFDLKPKNQRRIAVAATATLGIIVALQSIGQLTVRDVATIVPLILVLYVYLSYTKSRRA